MVQFRLTLALAFILCFAVFATARTCVADQSGLIYIHADGSIDPPTAPISTVDNITYTLTGDIFNESIVIERNNTVVDGALHTIAGTWSSQGNSGVQVSESSNVTIKNFMIREASIRINPYSSYVTIFENTITDDVYTIGYSLTVTNAQNNTISKNNITDSGGGISLYNSRGNRIFGNNIIGNNAWGITIGYYSSNNTICGNNIANNLYGIEFDSSSNNNTVYHNNFVNNTVQVDASNSQNIWNMSYGNDDLIWGGNYWSDYNGTNDEGMGTTPYVIDKNNSDNNPWLGMFNFFTFYNSQIVIISNSSIYDLDFEQINQTYARLIFKTSGPSGTEGFVRICVSNTLLDSHNWSMKKDGEQCLISFYVSNLTAWNTYIEYSQSVHQFEITGTTTVPEFPSFIILPLLMIAASVAVIVCKRKRLV